MATLVSAGVSVQIVDDSFYISPSASTRPLFFIATRGDKKQPNGVSDALGSREHSIVRTITSLNQSVAYYGIPHFRKDNAGSELHGDVRNEYGLFALNQYLSVANTAYVVRADVDLADSDIISLSVDTPVFSGIGDGTIQGITVDQVNGVSEMWTLIALDSTTFAVTGFSSGPQGNAQVGVPYNNGYISFNITQGSVPFAAGDVFQITIASAAISNPLGANDAAKRVSIVTALQAEINSNMDVRSEYYEYNIIICPGYHEVVDELINLSQSINDEAFVIADTPFTLTPEDTATWSLTSARYRSQNVGYYYPHGLGSNLDGRDVFVAASGTALKTITYSDNVTDVWYAPAGLRRGIVTGISKVGYVSGTLGTATSFIETPLNQGQRDVLYEFFKNVNPITFLPGRGIIVFGQKTSYSAASALDRINVVRLLMKIKRDVRKASMAYLFEINDRITRESMKSMIDGYLHDILVRRGLYDYAVIIDESNNSGTTIDRNELHATLLLKPSKSIEFIYVSMKILRTDAQI